MRIALLNRWSGWQVTYKSKLISMDWDEISIVLIDVTVQQGILD